MTERQFLDLWERCLDASPLARASALAGAAVTVGEAADVDALTLGERERLLLRLRARLFGPGMAGLASCPACTEPHDITFDVQDLLERFPPAAAGPVTVASDGWHVTARSPTARDLESVQDAAGTGDSATQLLRLCVLEARHEDRPVASDALPREVRDALGAALSAADPFADLTLELRCGACGHAWMTPLDAATWLWSELQAWARRLLLDVHGLASAYGWTEEQVLQLSPWRRAAYLSLAGR